MDYIDKNRTRGLRRAQKALIADRVKKKIVAETHRITIMIANYQYPSSSVGEYYQDKIDNLPRSCHKNEGREGRRCFDCGPKRACEWCVRNWYAKFVRTNDAFDLDRYEWFNDPDWCSYDSGDMQEEYCHLGDVDFHFTVSEARLKM